MQYGYFDDENREYIITNPRTPVKWVNYIGTLDFGGFLDHTGGLQLCKGDPALNRITKYIPQLPSSDFKGETAYLRYRKPGDTAKEANLISPYWLPTFNDYDLFQCHVGLYYNRWKTEISGFSFDILAFIPQGGTEVIRQYKITNNTSEVQQLEFFPVVEYSHFDALKQLTNADWVPQTMQSHKIDFEDGRGAIASYAFMKRDEAVNVLYANRPAIAWETDRKRFLGDNEYGTWREPLALKEERLSCKNAVRGDTIAALQLDLGLVQPGDSVSFITLLTQGESLESIPRICKKYMSEADVSAAFSELSAFWDRYLSVFKVETPSEAFNSMINVHNPRQCYTTKMWSRYMSLYQLGYGSDRGIGFRDSSQDTMGVIAQIPHEARELMEKLLSVQSQDGSAYHQFNPLSMEAGRGDSLEYEDRPHYYSDDQLWIVLAVIAYLKETGDYAFLDKTIPFYEKDREGQPIEKGTVYEHLQRAVNFTKQNTGKHGLPLLGFADWNDTVNLPTGAESVFTANLYGWALKELSALADFRGEKKHKEKYDSWYDEMKKTVLEKAWDGEWFVRYFDEKGEAIGSNKNEYGKIWLNAQSWALLSGFASDSDKGRRAMEAVQTHLATEKGIKLSWPGYNGYDREKGGVTSYPPGAKENGGIFLHPNPWAIMAETMLGNGDRAFSYYNNINPAAKNDIMDEYECEPYCYAQNILSDEHPQFGLGRNSWLSGTASWMYQSSTQYILGLRPEHEGLLFDPCIPHDWKEFKIERKCRGAIYDIRVENLLGKSKGVRSILVDGKAITGNLIPYFTEGRHTVEVIM